MKGLFVAGTGTGVGKTMVAAGLLRLFRARGVDAVPMKPVQTGAVRGTDGSLRAPDLEFVLGAAGLSFDAAARAHMAPYCYEPACSPHLAARLEERAIDLTRIAASAKWLSDRHGALVVEAAGGLLVPLAPGLTTVDLMARLGLPAVLVSHAGLGAINHTLLSLEALRSRGLAIWGVVLCDTSPAPEEERFIREENARAIEELGRTKVLARVPYLGAPVDWGALDRSLSACLDGRELPTGSGGLDVRDLRRRDIRHLWHPYTEITSFEVSEFPIVDRARGCSLFDVEGRELLDGIASWWCVNLGHSHPRLVRAIQSQADQLQHTLLGGMSHPGAIALAERLAQIAPRGLGHALFASDGTSAVEAALKIALQYWVNLGESGRTSFLALEEGYHGDSLGAVGVGYVEAFHRPFAPAIRPAFRALSPHCNRCPVGREPESCSVECFDSMAALIRGRGRECAGVIVEPLCQAAGGMRIYPAEYLRRLRAACSEAGLLLIADEIAVGMGRTGSAFACERAGIAPDLMTLGKGLTGGLLPMSATLVTDAVYDSFRADGERARTFFHGHTFCGNPIAAALALAALDVYEEDEVLERLPPRIRQLDEGMGRIAQALQGSKVRSLGMIPAVELGEAAGSAARAKRIARRAVELGLFIRPLGETIYLWPPLTCTEGELGRMIELLERAVEGTR